MRRLVCTTCAPKWAAGEAGFKVKLVVGTVKATLPADHGIRVDDVFFASDGVVCDDCNAACPAGEPAVAVDMVRTRQPWPADWTVDYLDDRRPYDELESA